MSVYSAPIREILFSLFNVNNFAEHYESIGLSEELVSAIFKEAGKFAEQELFPLNATGDRQGVQFDAGKVTSPSGFKQAYRQYVEGGWPSLAQPEAFGGQGLPPSLSKAVSELWHSANQGWSMYSTLGEGACETLLAYGSDTQKQLYLPKLVSGEWTGTMCLTEAQAGSDLGLLRTGAKPTADGAYRITGSKIFISSGDHDLAENIVHLVLARLPDAPQGTRGISLFLVPKIKVDADGTLGEFNNVSCGSVEYKMGLKGSATCVMNFDDAEGFLLGPANKGLACMFTFMNSSRLGVAVQGQGQAEGAYQMSLAYAKERLQGRAPAGAQYPERNADPITAHPDVQRMLLTQQVFAQGGRSLAHYCAKLLDQCESSNEAVADKAEKLLALLIPVAKACLTEWGSEACDLGVQIFGGHGYVSEWGIEQRLRDVRITRIYEGTNGIQGLDFLGRKVLVDRGSTLQLYLDEMLAFSEQCQSSASLTRCAIKLKHQIIDWKALNTTVFDSVQQGPGRLETIAFDYLMYAGYIVLAYQWLRIAKAVVDSTDDLESDWLQGQLAAADFCFARVLPRSGYHRQVILESDR